MRGLKHRTPRKHCGYSEVYSRRKRMCVALDRSRMSHAGRVGVLQRRLRDPRWADASVRELLKEELGRIILGR